MTSNFGERLAAFNSPRFERLRPAQEHVLEQYLTSHVDTRDLAIELPTGVGKTLIALLIADYALDRGRAVAYLAGSNILAAQVANEARDLPGLEVRQFWGGHYPGASLDDYHQAQAVGVMNYWVYFNSNPRIEPGDLVIFDDAHLGEQPLAGMYSVRIGRNAHPELYAGVCDQVLAHTAAYESLPALRDGTAPGGAPPELLAFNDWAAISRAVVTTIDGSSYAASDEGRFVWPQIRARLDRVGVLIGPSAIEIRPYHPPSQTFDGVSRATQRIYLSATLGTMDDLERRLGIGPIERIETPAGLHAGGTGRRLFVVNPSLDASLPQPLSDLVLELAGDEERVAWLCASHYEADQVQGVLQRQGAPVFRLRPGDDGAIEEWRNAGSGHLVAAGRFDGLDFAGDLCRLVVLPSVPAASSEFERFVVAYLGDASFMRHRIGQRVTQAMGRANRTPDDWAVYVGLDPGFAGTLAQPTIRNAMDEDTSRVVRRALELHEEGWPATEAAVRAFWAGEEQPMETRPARRPGRATAGQQAGASSTAGHEVSASTGLWLGDFDGAAAAARAASEGLQAAGESEHSAFWRYVEAHAHHAARGPRSEERAAAAIRGALADGPRTAWFIRLRRTLDELEGRAIEGSGHDDLFLAWDAWLRDSGSRAQRAVHRGQQLMLGTHDQRAEGLLMLARLAGTQGDRPLGAAATDVRWVWVDRGTGQRRMWEIKTGQAAGAVTRGDINQLLGQLQIELQDHPRSSVHGCLLTVHETVNEDAAAAARDRVAIVSDQAALALYLRLSDRFLEYQRVWGSGTAQERGAARASVEPRLPPPGWLRRMLAPTGGRVVTLGDVEAFFDGQQAR